MRRYDDPVEVRRGDESPEQFLWRGRLWKVRAVLAHWVETGPWWQSGGVRAVIGSDDPAESLTNNSANSSANSSADLLAEREVWRVEASRGRAVATEPDGGGVFDLSFDWNDGTWLLVGCAD
jgi:hypothetical protein